MAVDRVRCRELTNADDDNDIAARIEQGFIQACFFLGGGNFLHPNLKLPPRILATSVITTWILKLKCNANYSTGISYLLSEVLIFVDKCAKSPNSPNLHGFNKLRRARDTTELLRRTTSDFVVPGMWSPNSPDLNLVDYVTWSVIQQRVYYETRVHDVDELRQRLLHVWCSLEQSLIDDAVDQCPTAFACLCSCQRRTFWTCFVTINFFPCTW